MVGSMSGDYSESRLALGLGDMLRNSEISIQVVKRFWFYFYVYMCAFKNKNYNKIFVNYL